jgi:hypothetical protein
MAVIRFLFALLLGFVLGAGAALWLVQSGAGDFMIRRTAVVQDLELKVRDLEQQRDRLGRTFEDLTARTNRMEQAFLDLERRHKDPAAERAPVTPPSPAAPAPREDMAAPAQP